MRIVAGRRESSRGRLGFAAIVVGALALLVAFGLWLRTLAVRQPESLPVLGVASGAEIERLRGFVVVADVIDPAEQTAFSRSLRMADFQSAFEKARNVRLLTFVRPAAGEKPVDLARLANDLGARPGRWDFVPASDLPPFAGFFVIDPLGRIRARPDEKSPEVSSEVLDAVGDLLRERSQ